MPEPLGCFVEFVEEKVGVGDFIGFSWWTRGGVIDKKPTTLVRDVVIRILWM